MNNFLILGESYDDCLYNLKNVLRRCKKKKT